MQDVRVAAIEGMPDLVKSLKAAVDKGTASPDSLSILWGKIFTQLMQAAIMEPEPADQSTVLQSVCACIEACGDRCLTDEQQLQLCQVRVHDKEKDGCEWQHVAWASFSFGRVLHSLE